MKRKQNKQTNKDEIKQIEKSILAITKDLPIVISNRKHASNFQKRCIESQILNFRDGTSLHIVLSFRKYVRGFKAVSKITVSVIALSDQVVDNHASSQWKVQ